MNLFMFLLWTAVVWFASKKYEYYKGWQDGYDEIKRDLSIHDN